MKLPPAQTSRRHFLKGAGVLIALPALESTLRASGAASAPRPKNAPVKRFVCIGANLGLHTPALYPAKEGADYEITPSLEPLKELREDFTLFSGLDHRAPGGHGNWPNFLCGKNLAEMSLDQRVASRIGNETRFASLVLSAGSGGSSMPMSYLKGKIALPAMERPSVLYRKLFASASDRARTEYLLKSGRSALDFVLEDAKTLQRNVSAYDRAKLEEYFTALREVEGRMGRQLSRVNDAVPTVEYALPAADPVATNLMMELQGVLYDLMALALQTDSTRVISLALPGGEQTFTLGGKRLRNGYHNASHHGNDPEKIAELMAIDRENLRCFGRFLSKIKAARDAEDRSLLESSILLFGTGMGDASRHANTDLPTIVAGGGFKHGRHLRFTQGAVEREQRLLGDLFISIERRLGIESQSFCAASHSLDEVLL
ncbi:MAG: hypothetical protein RLZZ142_1577 [Verrucomicrobiota bacterium]